MTTTLIYPKEKFEKELKQYISEGEKLLKREISFTINLAKIKSLERDYKFWKQEVQEFLKARFTPTYDNEFLKAFNQSDLYNFSPLAKSLSGKDVNSPLIKFETFQENCQSNIDSLILLERKLKFISEEFPNLDTPSKTENMKKIFISHSSLDAKYVEKIIDVLEIIGVPSDLIFCSSFEGYGVKLGSDFLDYLKDELNNEVLVIFTLSNNFYASPISLCEMGATWIKTNQHIPILIPPFEYSDVKGVIPTAHGMKIDEKERYNSLKEIIETFLALKPIAISVWERKRDNLLKEIKKLQDSTGINLEPQNVATANTKHGSDDDYYKNSDEIIKRRAAEEWPNDFEMQVYHIEKNRNAVESLKQHNPIDIDKEQFRKIRENARVDWKDDFEMQLDYEQRQVESLRRLKNM